MTDHDRTVQRLVRGTNGYRIARSGERPTRFRAQVVDTDGHKTTRMFQTKREADEWTPIAVSPKVLRVARAKAPPVSRHEFRAKLRELGIGYRPTPSMLLKDLEQVTAGDFDEVQRLLDVAVPPTDAVARALYRERLMVVLKSLGFTSPSAMADTWMTDPKRAEKESKVQVDKAVRQFIDEPEPWPTAVDGAELLVELENVALLPSS